METREMGTERVIAGVPAPYERQVPVAAMDVEAAAPAQDGEAKACKTVAIRRAKDTPPEATSDHLGAIALVGPAVGVMANVLGAFPTDEGVGRHAIRVAPGATVAPVGRSPA